MADDWSPRDKTRKSLTIDLWKKKIYIYIYLTMVVRIMFERKKNLQKKLYRLWATRAISNYLTGLTNGKKRLRHSLCEKYR